MQWTTRTDGRTGGQSGLIAHPDDPSAEDFRTPADFPPMEQLTIVALLATSSALAVASAKGVLVLVFRLMVRFNGAHGSAS